MERLNTEKVRMMSPFVITGLCLFLGSHICSCIKVSSADQSATHVFFSHYSLLRRSWSSMLKLIEDNPLCTLPTSEKQKLCLEIVNLVYELNIPEFQLTEDASPYSFICIKEKNIGGDTTISKKMYTCPVNSMVIENKPENAQNLLIGNGYKLGSVFVFSRSASHEVLVKYYITDVDIVRGTPQPADRRKLIEMYYIQHCTKRKRQCSMPSFPSGPFVNKNQVCSLAHKDKMILCGKIIGSRFGVTVDQITYSLTQLPTINCEKKKIIFSGGKGKKSTRLMFLCPVSDMNFPNKPENPTDLYISKGDITGTVFVMEATDDRTTVKLIDYIRNIYFFM